MTRRNLFKNALLGLAISLVPEILRPKEVDFYDAPPFKQPYFGDEIGQVWIVKHFDGRQEIGYLEMDERSKVKFIKVQHH